MSLRVLIVELALYLSGRRELHVNELEHYLKDLLKKIGLGETDLEDFLRELPQLQLRKIIRIEDSILYIDLEKLEHDILEAVHRLDPEQSMLISRIMPLPLKHSRLPPVKLYKPCRTYLLAITYRDISRSYLAELIDNYFKGKIGVITLIREGVELVAAEVYRLDRGYLLRLDGLTSYLIEVPDLEELDSIISTILPKLPDIDFRNNAKIHIIGVKD